MKCLSQTDISNLYILIHDQHVGLCVYIYMQHTLRVQTTLTYVGLAVL